MGEASYQGIGTVTVESGVDAGAARLARAMIRCSASSILAIAASGLLAASASAQEVPAGRADIAGSDQIPDIVVTAQKRDESVKDVPMSITAISGTRLDQAGVTNALDLSRAVPGLAVAETSPGRQTISIRGISSIRGSSSLTGIYLDDAPLTGAQDGFLSSYADVQVLDLNRVEVLKGPQGTLFGEGSVGGTIRFITNDPNLTRAGGTVAGEVSNTNDGGWNGYASGVINVPIVNDVFGIRVAGSYAKNSGWIDQPSIGRTDINDSSIKHLRIKALLAPATGLTIKGLVEIHRNEGGASNIVNVLPFEKGDFIQGFVTGAGRTTPTNYSDNYDLYNLAINYDFGFAQLLSSTSHAKFYSQQSLTEVTDEQPTPYLEIVIPKYALNSSITAQELRLTSEGNTRFKWTIGGNYKRDELSSSYIGGYNALLFGGLFPLTGLSANLKPTTISQNYAAFGDASYKIFDRLELGGGLRYFHDHRESFDPTLPAIAMQSRNFSKVTFRAYAKFEASREVNLYVNVANGFRSGGFNDPSVGPRGAPTSYDPETSIFYEGGVKAALMNGTLRFSAAGFYGRFKGLQNAVTVTSPVDGNPLQYTTNSQDAELKGFEAEMSWRPVRSLTLSVAGDYTDTRITRVDPADLTPTFKVGDPINLVPKYSLNASAEYAFKWAEAVPGQLLVSYARKGKSSYTDRSTTLILQPQYVAPETGFLNASLSADISGWNVSVFGRNLTNDRKPITASNSGITAQARPRTIGIGFRKSF